MTTITIKHILFLLLVLISGVVKSTISFAQEKEKNDVLSSKKLKSLSLEDLMDIEVISISMQPEKLNIVASAVQVITNREIKRSGVTRLPEALRLASNLQIAQSNSHDWAITARGFNGLPSSGGILANKLLVMIDGRSIYNPLFGGVYWDVQNVLLEDVDRIEVVSGPGGTLWGANAVNGVINIITKSAKETQGLFVSGGGGSFLKSFGQIRYGFQVDSILYVRTYGQYFNQTNTKLKDETSTMDAWDFLQGGFRMDYYPSAKNTLTLQGDLYESSENDSVRLANTDGQNVLARFSHVRSENSDVRVQFYYDRTWRKTPNSTNKFYYELNTYDVDLQYRFPLGDRQSILVGANYRHQKDKTPNSLNPSDREMPVYSGFVQDEISIGSKAKFTIGSKFLDNVFSGFEIQPGIRLSYVINEKYSIWSAISRTTRIPTRFDSDVTITPVKFNSEKVMAYELGCRLQPVNQLFISIATFYNNYHDLRSLDSTSNPSTPIALANSQLAESWGLEISAKHQINSKWHLHSGFTYFEKNIWSNSDLVLPVSTSFEGVDPNYLFIFQSILDLSKNLQLDFTGRYVDSLPKVTGLGSPISRVPSYFTFDTRIAWNFKNYVFCLVGQNLLESKHTEVGSSTIPRMIYGKISCQF